MLRSREMPGAQWFPDAKVNYAAHALPGARRARGGRPLAVARAGRRGRSASCASASRGRGRELARLGVGRGDRVVAYLPNIPETLAWFLGAASLGAIWASVSPEFGPRSVIDRFAQIEPKVLIAVESYMHRGKPIDRPLDAIRCRAADARARHRTRDPAGGRRAGDRAAAVRPPAVRAVLLRHHRAAQADRPRPRRDRPRALQEHGDDLGHPGGRPAAAAHDDRLDDVERDGQRADAARVDRDLRRRRGVAGARPAVAGGAGDARRA